MKIATDISDLLASTCVNLSGKRTVYQYDLSFFSLVLELSICVERFQIGASKLSTLIIVAAFRLLDF